MRRSGHTDRPVGFRLHDHLCWVHDGTDAWPDVVAPYLQEGAAADEQLLYIAGKDEDDLVADLAGLPARDAMLSSGQLKIMTVADAYGPAGDLDPEQQVLTYRTAALRAVENGFRGLRLAADVSALVTTEKDARSFTAYEMLLDEMIMQTPLVCLCGYDRSTVDSRTPAMASFVHPLCHPVADTGQEGIHADRDGWHLCGELDLRNIRTLEVVLSTLPTCGDVHLHLSNLRYCDAASVRALVKQAARLHPDGQLVLHNPPPLFVWALEAGWPGELPGLKVVGR